MLLCPSCKRNYAVRPCLFCGAQVCAECFSPSGCKICRGRKM
ncbi:MAG TPA: hypothetical protein VI933_05220 [archaeon]|nr:hypothetical protein [archaeon]